jgi:hypothetical protein
MIGKEACQKGGSMRSKSLAERPKNDQKLCAPAACTPHAPGALSLVRADAQPARALKPGLY